MNKDFDYYNSLYYLELVLIAEKDKLKEYIKYSIKYNVFNSKYHTETILDLRKAFTWNLTKEGYKFWQDICVEAYLLSEVYLYE